MAADGTKRRRTRQDGPLLANFIYIAASRKYISLLCCPVVATPLLSRSRPPMSQPIAPAGSMAPNAYRLLLGGFMAILAAGVGFAIRGGFLDNWGAEYDFTAKELGDISGMGFTGFCFG